MRIHCLQHVPFEDPGYLLSLFHEKGGHISSTRLYNHEPLPELFNFDMLVIMGGPMGVYDESQHPWLVREKKFIEKTMHAGKHVLGICLGAQMIAAVLGARVERNPLKEIGWFPVIIEPNALHAGICAHIPGIFKAFHWHGDTFDIPAGAQKLCRSDACPNQAFITGERTLALQFHLECTEKSINNLIDNCPDDFEESPFVQSIADVRSGMNNIKACNEIMGRIITNFAVGL